MIKNEIISWAIVKTQIGLLVKFLIIGNNGSQYMEHYFKQNNPVIINRNNKAMMNDAFNRFIDQGKGEIEAWSQRGSGWVIERILAAFFNAARYEPFRGGSYFPLPKQLQNKKAIINIQNRDNQCLRWAIRAALFLAAKGKKVERTSSYPTEDSLNFTGIDFPTPVSQIDKLEKQNPNLAINVFGWENEHVIVHRIGEKDVAIQRINLMLIQQGENTHYSNVRRLSALCMIKTSIMSINISVNVVCMGTKQRIRLEKHKPECKGLFKRPTRVEMPKEGENKVSFTNYR